MSDSNRQPGFFEVSVFFCRVMIAMRLERGTFRTGIEHASHCANGPFACEMCPDDIIIP